MEYRVTCKGMFINGELHRQGQTFEATEENAERMLNERPRKTFEATHDENKRENPLGRHGGKDDSAGDARLHASVGKSENVKKPRAKQFRK